jgi:hypothetical protein
MRSVRQEALSWPILSKPAIDYNGALSVERSRALKWDYNTARWACFKAGPKKIASPVVPYNRPAIRYNTSP